jgi:hypothetical protein
MSRTRRQIAAMVSILCLLFAAAGCSSGSGGGTKAFAKPPTTGLAGYLEKPPAKSSPGGSSWAKKYEPTVQDFVDYFYGAQARKTITDQLATQGLSDLAHVLWIAADRVQSDIVLLQFSTPAGAAARLAAVQAVNRSDSTLTSYTLPGRGAPVVYYQKHADAQNRVIAKGYAVVGNILVEMFTVNPVEYARGELELWLGDQLKLLP